MSFVVRPTNADERKIEFEIFNRLDQIPLVLEQLIGDFTGKCVGLLQYEDKLCGRRARPCDWCGKFLCGDPRGYKKSHVFFFRHCSVCRQLHAKCLQCLRSVHRRDCIRGITENQMQILNEERDTMDNMDWLEEEKLMRDQGTSAARRS
jgi:hypothetical protein